MLKLLPSEPYINADETSIQVLATEKTRRAYIWTFIANHMVVYIYSPTRSGETPVRVLGESQGFIQVDGYSGYNQVCKPECRTRIGCLAHFRRYFFKALEYAPKEADWVLKKILELYQIEYKAAEDNILSTEKHLALRKACSAPLMDELALYLEEQQELHLPEGPFGKALTYAKNNWTELNIFLTDPKIPLDNNISERQLRIVALGRKNFLFLGNDLAGDHFAVLQSLVSTCELNGINPLEYLTDVLIRTQKHPASQIDELLPQNWIHPNSS